MSIGVFVRQFGDQAPFTTIPLYDNPSDLDSSYFLIDFDVEVNEWRGCN